MQEPERIEFLITKLARFYSVMGNRPDEPGALALMAEILSQSASDAQLAAALTRCAHECRYPVRLSDILQRVPGLEVPRPEAEARKAWDDLMRFVSVYVGNDVWGNFGPEHGWHPKSFPKLSRQILDAVRRTGGWKLYKCMANADFPFVQKRFFEEYAAWTAVEQVELGRLLTEIPQPQLVAKVNSAPKAEIRPKPAVQQIVLKKIPGPLTDAQSRERLEVLRQQVEFLSRNRNGDPKHSDLPRGVVKNNSNTTQVGHLQPTINDGAENT